MLNELTTAQHLDAIDWDHWQATHQATLLLTIKNDKILLIRKKRGLGAGKINGPGGKVESGETILDCIIRETQEELCITPIDPNFIGESLFQFKDGYSIHVHTFIATEFKGEPTETDEAYPIWFPLDNIPYDEMWEDDKYWIPLALKGQRFIGRYLFDDDKMLDYDIKLIDASPE
ncbi:MAG: 8-oxo-dGTP diphosphatase [Endozoicomonas sp. (ex Botrylloides leachii)]|nr:8-oxo-dGTP diphosphatase [Endozoicomonas sp. (ex Botrylloides leachii)]